MATTLTRFEVRIPSSDYGGLDDLAVQQFLTNLRTLTQVTIYNCGFLPQGGNGYDGYFQGNIFFGTITAAQQATALQYLATLNANVSFAPVLCLAWSVQSEP